MKIISHGVYYKHEVEVRCEECDCKFIINDKKDVCKYNKPIKIVVGMIDCCWNEKRNYYTKCPECWHENPLTDREYEILTKRIK